MNQELSSLIDSIRNIPLDDELSDDAVIALSRSYISMQNLVVANGLESDYGNRKEFENALDILYGICSRRCRSSQPFARRSRMIPILYRIVYLQMRGVEIRKSEACNEYLFRLVDEWMKHPETHEDRTLVYGVLCCISDLFSDVAEKDRTDDAEFLWFKQRVSDWAAMMDDEGVWRGIPICEALCRLEIMSRNSSVFLDSSNDSIIEKSRMGYCKSVLERLRCSNGQPMRNSGLILFMLYEIMMWGIGEPDDESVIAIAESAKRLAKQHPYGSEEWLLDQSTYLDRLCMQVGSEIQDHVFAHIA